MKKPDLNAIRNKIREQEEKRSEARGQRNFGDMYPFWHIEEGQKAIIRILPHKDMEDDSITPFIDKLEHILAIGGKDVKIPCRRMYGDTCPICELSAKYYKAEGKTSEKGKYYWRDKKSLASAYIVKDPLPPHEETGENDQGKMKVVQLGNQLSNKYESRFKELLNDEEIDDLPWSLENGLDFYIVKEKQGTYAKYDTLSDFARKQTSLPQEFIDSFTPIDLKKYLPKDPGAEKVQRMLDAHLTGEEYVDDEDTDSQEESSSLVREAAKPAPSLKKESPKPSQHDVVTKETAKEVEEEESDDDFIARIRRRNQAKQ